MILHWIFRDFEATHDFPLDVPQILGCNSWISGFFPPFPWVCPPFLWEFPPFCSTSLHHAVRSLAQGWCESRPWPCPSVSSFLAHPPWFHIGSGGNYNGIHHGTHHGYINIIYIIYIYIYIYICNYIYICVYIYNIGILCMSPTIFLTEVSWGNWDTWDRWSSWKH